MLIGTPIEVGIPYFYEGVETEISMFQDLDVNVAKFHGKIETKSGKTGKLSYSLSHYVLSD